MTPGATSAAASASRGAGPLAARRSRGPAGVLLASGTAGLLALLFAGRAAGDGGEVSALDRAGPVTDALLPVARLGGELAALVVVAGVAACLLTVRRPPVGLAGPVGPAGPVVPVLPRSVAVGAGLWAVLCLCSALLSASDISNQPVPQVLRTGLLLDYLRIIPQARTQAVAGALALAVALLALVARRVPVRATLPVLGAVLVATAAALAWPLTTGHSASAANHRLAISTLVVHVLAAAAWVGGLAGLVLHLRDDHAGLRLAVGRFQAVALTAFVVVAGTGLVNAWTRVDDPALLTSTAYGRLVLAKAAALVLLGGFGAWHRRRTVRSLNGGAAGAFRRLAAAEVVVMAATVGLAVALSRTPTP